MLNLIVIVTGLSIIPIVLIAGILILIEKFSKNKKKKDLPE
jgi:hypothetical protein